MRAPARPKSVTLATPSAVIITLAGLTSRWTRPCSCASCRPQANWMAVSRIASRVARRRVADGVPEGAAVHELGEDARDPFQAPHVVAGHHVRVEREVDPRLRLALEGLDAARGVQRLLERDLDREVDAPAAVVDAVDAAHAALAEQAGDLVEAEHDVARAAIPAGRPRRARLRRRSGARRPVAAAALPASSGGARGAPAGAAGSRGAATVSAGRRARAARPRRRRRRTAGRARAGLRRTVRPAPRLPAARARPGAARRSSSRTASTARSCRPGAPARSRSCGSSGR